ncbi:ABC transporter permease [Streptomyces sp. NPDC101062]|uniref:ABC transporter permease n=1 Tax=unclassified Streptomyces TaxID=2593676 RepID=UPI0037FD90CE
MTDTRTDPPPTSPDSHPAPDSARSPSHTAWRELRRRPLFLFTSGCVLLLLVMAAVPGLFAGWFGHGDPRACDLDRSSRGPAPGHPFGFDVQGCDLYANVVHGAGASVGIGLLATGCGLAVALVLGCLAGMSGRIVDSVIARLTDVFLGFPFLLGAIIVLNTVTTRNVTTVAAVLALFGWPPMARVVRASVRSAREADYVTTARSMGAGEWHIVRRHVLPHVLTPVLVLASITVGGVVVAEAGLTFLGVGIQAPALSWGLQLASAQNSFAAHPHLLIFPGLFLSFTVYALIAFGDTVRDALDPRTR